MDSNEVFSEISKRPVCIGCGAPLFEDGECSLHHAMELGFVDGDEVRALLPIEDRDLEVMTENDSAGG